MFQSMFQTAQVPLAVASKYVKGSTVHRVWKIPRLL